MYVDFIIESDEFAKAVVSITNVKGEDISKEELVISGTKKEVDAKISELKGQATQFKMDVTDKRPIEVK